MRVVVATVAHRGDDARIVHRQARALLEAGHSVVLIAPDPGEKSRTYDPPGLERVITMRATGRKRFLPWIRMSRRLGSTCRGADILLVHDPELVPIVAFRCLHGVIKVWDVHEDYLAHASDVQWAPPRARFVLRWGVEIIYWIARRRFRVFLAEESYVKNFPGASVIPNTAVVSEPMPPCSDPDQVVYLGRISRDRGCEEMIGIGRRLSTEAGLRLVLVGGADRNCEEALKAAHERGWVDWRGALPNPEARAVIRGSLAGLSLLHDVDNYRDSWPSKFFDYWSEGLPVLTTPLPGSYDLISTSNGGVVLSGVSGHSVVDETIRLVFLLRRDQRGHQRLARAGWEYAKNRANWIRDRERFVFLVEGMVLGNKCA